VADTGVGWSKENQDKLFVEGMQFDPNLLQAGGGSGLGLYIAKGIVDLHQGLLEATSEGEGKGATFRLELPLLRSDDVLADAEEEVSLPNRKSNMFPSNRLRERQLFKIYL
jgi:signal transduction histidine kinase